VEVGRSQSETLSETANWSYLKKNLKKSKRTGGVAQVPSKHKMSSISNTAKTNKNIEESSWSNDSLFGKPSLLDRTSTQLSGFKTVLMALGNCPRPLWHF
jgi:hypothetical protein